MCGLLLGLLVAAYVSTDHLESTAVKLNNDLHEKNPDMQKADERSQEDIIPFKEQHHETLWELGDSRIKRQAFKNETYKWTKLALNFTLNSTLSKRGRSAFRKAANLWTRNTCLDITEQEYEEGDEEYEEYYVYTGENGDYYYEEDNNYDNDSLHDYMEYTDFDLITVNSGNYCGSVVGRQPPLGWQTITLGRKCEAIGTAAHELGHALGFFHTHARYDRDEYITVNWTNIDGDDNIHRQFKKETNESNDNYGLPYDYGSVMHYGTTAGSVNRTKTTMMPKDGLYTQTLGSLLLSFYDILMMNTHYNCTGICKKNESAECKNKGFPHPRNCSECICPSGYGGRLCDERPPKICGYEVNATSNWTRLISNESSAMTTGSQDGYKRCVYWIKAPNGTKVEVKVRKLPENIKKEGCIYGGVEIKTYKDPGLTGYRFCSSDIVNTSLVSNLSTVPVIVFMRRRRNDTVTELEYRIAEEGNGERK